MREWLKTNALGSFAMGSDVRTPERKYHGLLVLRRPGCEEPLHVLSDVNEVIIAGGRTFELGSYHYETTDFPRGFEHQTSFDPDGPSWEYECNGVKVKRTLELARNRNEVTLRYQLSGNLHDAELRLSPLFTMRGLHREGYENPFLDGRAHEAADGPIFKLYRDLPGINVQVTPHAGFEPKGFWNRKVRYPEEARRGYDDEEDLFCPGYFSVHVEDEAEVAITFRVPGEAPVFHEERWSGPSFLDPGIQAFADRIAKAAEQFVYFEANSGEPGILAGYPWFGEWGRDTLIALPGLLLETARTQVAEAILDRYAECRRNGLIPNLVGDAPETSDWFSVDASLWFIRAVQDLHTQEGKKIAGRWFDTVLDILETLRSGNVPGVWVEESGLLGVDLRPRPGSWMDAQIHGQAVTPRAPFAVDLNALFYNAVNYALRLARQSGKGEFVERWSAIKDRLSTSFIETFWLEDEGYLADCHDGNAPDKSLRPNQLFATSMPFRSVSKGQAKRILENVRHYLRTPMGLRTLAPDDPKYRGQLIGRQEDRDLAYHNGTVWAWPLGMYVDTLHFVEGDEAALKEVQQIIQDLTPHLDDACIGQVSEVFDGDAPHTPRGAPAQAWSVSEILRAVYRYAPRNDERSRRMKAVQQASTEAVT